MADSAPYLNHSDIDPNVARRLTTQSYAKTPALHGVRIVNLHQSVDDGGSFAEVLRLDSNGVAEAFREEAFQVRQASFSVLCPGAIKAFHVHYRQDDVWFVPPSDRLLLGLVDVRAASATRSHTMRIVLGAGRAQLVFIPRGVAHGVANLSTSAGSVFYFVNQQFDIADPDERRLPWDLLGEDFWRITAG